MAWNKKQNPDEMTLVGHLAELRWRLLVVFISFAMGLAVGFYFAKDVLGVILAVPGELVYLAPGEAFFTHLKLALVIGAGLSLPMALWQLAAFIFPGLSAAEKKYLCQGLPAAFILFLLGTAFAYRVMVPITYAFFLGFGGESLRPLISVGSYVSFVLSLVIPFGLVFQLPLLVMVLTGVGLITPKFLKFYRKYAVLAIFILAALLTPPDIISQALMAGPLLVLYEASIIISGAVYWRRRRTSALQL